MKSNILPAADLSWTLGENGKQVLHRQLPPRQKEGEQRSMHCPGAVESDIPALRMVAPPASEENARQTYNDIALRGSFFLTPGYQ